MSTIGHNDAQRQIVKPEQKAQFDSFVLEKGIFSSVFEKDIRRVYLYKKTERLAKALHLIAPAFKNAHALRSRLERISVELVDASVLPPMAAKEALSRELLALSSMLSIARTAGYLSVMNAELIAKEAHILLSEIAAYEEPKLSFEETPTLAALAKSSAPREPRMLRQPVSEGRVVAPVREDKGHMSDIKDKNGRKDAIISVLKSKGPSYIKDISTIIRDVSEKTIQRELINLVLEGRVRKSGERRWTTYTLVEGNP